MEKIIGIECSSGEFNGIKYTNYLINCQFDPLERGSGVCVHIYKMKSKYMEEMLKHYQLANVYDLIGLVIENRYQNIDYDANKNIKFINLKRA